MSVSPYLFAALWRKDVIHNSSKQQVLLIFEQVVQNLTAQYVIGCGREVPPVESVVTRDDRVQPGRCHHPADLSRIIPTLQGEKRESI